MNSYKKIATGFEIILYKEFYEQEAVFNVAYKYNDKFLITISPSGKDKIRFGVEAKIGSELPSQKDIEKILAEFIDEQVKINILRKTHDIRTIIYKKAFSPVRGIEE